MRIQLRANRVGVVLPDSHGQIWAELAALAAADPTLFSGATKDLGVRLTRELSLSRVEGFPTRRLVTLWRNERWRPMITRWCSSPVGRESFGVSTWEAMASYRIDEVSSSTCLLLPMWQSS